MGLSRLGKLVVYVLLGFWTLVCVFPLYWVFITSLKREADVANGPSYLPFVDFQPVFRAWRFIFADPYESMLWPALNSTIVAFGSTLITLLMSSAAVYGMTRFGSGEQTRRDHWLFAILASRVLPPVAVVLPVWVMARYTGLLDTRILLMLVYAAVNLPVAVWLLRPVFGDGPSDQENAARLEGATHAFILWHVVLPMAAMGVFASGVLIFVLCWNEYLFAAYLTTDHAITIPPYLVGQMSIKEAQVGSEAEEWANFSSATVAASVPLLACTALVQRFLGRIGLFGK
jgi:multiple sugar transport system permease protein